MNNTDTMRRADGLAQRLFEQRMLVITTHDSVLHRFNEVGTFVWDLLATPRTTAEIITAVGAHFDGFDTADGPAEIGAFISMLINKKLVVVQQH